MWLSTATTIVIALQRQPVLLELWLALCVTVFVSVIALIRSNRIANLALLTLVILGFITGGLLALTRALPIVHSPVVRLAASEQVVDFDASVTGDPILSVKKDALAWRTVPRVAIHIRLETVHQGEFTTRVRIPAELFSTRSTQQYLALIPGTRIRAAARLSPVQPGAPFAVYLTALTRPRVVGGPPRYQWLASQLRTHLKLALAHTPTDAKALVPGLALGDTSALSPELQSAMRTAGLTHLVAVSGANVTILLTIVFTCLPRARMRTRVICALVLLTAFVIIVRPQPSVLRAATMGVVVLVGNLLARRAQAIVTLAVAVIVLLVIDPLLAATYGFALSVAATAGLLVYSPSLKRFLASRLPKRIPAWLIDGLVVTLAAQFAVAPILVQLGGPISLAAIPANLIAVPLASGAMVTGLVLTGASLLYLPLAQVIAWIAALLAMFIADVARAASAATFLVVPWPSGVIGVLLSLLACLGLILTVRFWSAMQNNQRSLVALTALALVSALWLRPTVSWKMWPPPNWVMVSCDVGQGDATVLNLGNHQGIVVDAGPDAALVDKCLSNLHINSIPLLVLTHFHADHVGGIEGVLHQRRVGMIRVSPLAEPALTTQFVADVFAKHKLQMQPISSGEHIVIAGIDLTCLWPAQVIRGEGSDPNNASVVLLAQIRGNLIALAGDVETPAQAAIAHKYHLPKVQVLKIAHHGSRKQDPEFARELSPDIGIVSVGANNDYGHPAPETLQLYRALGTRLYRTDQVGAISVVDSGGRLQVVTAR
jgi:competence protein ComEC